MKKNRSIYWYILPLAIFILLLWANLAVYKQSQMLARSLIYGETKKIVQNFRLHLKNWFLERTNDIRLLAFYLEELPLGEREYRFLQTAEAIIEKEPSYHVINFIDIDSIIRISAPRGKQPELIGLDLKTLPGRTILHEEVLASGEPKISTLFILTTGVPGVVIWYPTRYGLIAGTLKSDTIINEALHNSVPEDFRVLVTLYEDIVYQSAGYEQESSTRENGFLRNFSAEESFEILGREWSVRCWTGKNGYYQTIHQTNIRQFILSLSLSLFVFILLILSVWSLLRMRRGNIRLKESEQRLSLALQGADLGLWYWEIPSGKITVNERWTEILGYSRDEIEPTIKIWENLVHEEERPAVMERLNSHLQGKTSVYKSEHRLREKNGSWVWVLDKGMIVERDSAGRPARAAGTIMDITERKDMENEIIRSLEVKETLLKEIHHRVKNNLQIIISLLNLQSEKLRDAAVKQGLNESKSRIFAMALVHEKLYQSKDISTINLKNYLPPLVNTLCDTYNTGTRIRLNLEIQDIRLPINLAVPLGLILHELVSNVLKYAFPEKIEEGILSISCKEDIDRRTLVVADNGIGFSENIFCEDSETLGFRLVFALTKQIGGFINVDNSGGTAFTLCF